MNFKGIIQVVICFLLGFMAKAETVPVEQPNVIDTPCWNAMTHAYVDTEYQDDPVELSAQFPDPKNLKNRTRFRAASSYTVSSTPIAEEVQSFDHSTLAEPLCGSNNQRILPFYYIFLFRFTPF